MEKKMQVLVPMVIEQTTRGFERAYDIYSRSKTGFYLLVRQSTIMSQI